MNMFVSLIVLIISHCIHIPKIRLYVFSESHFVMSDCTVHGILQARILEWVAVPFSRGSFQPRN